MHSTTHNPQNKIKEKYIQKQGVKTFLNSSVAGNPAIKLKNKPAYIVENLFLKNSQFLNVYIFIFEHKSLQVMVKRRLREKKKFPQNKEKKYEPINLKSSIKAADVFKTLFGTSDSLALFVLMGQKKDVKTLVQTPTAYPSIIEPPQVSKQDVS